MGPERRQEPRYDTSIQADMIFIHATSSRLGVSVEVCIPQVWDKNTSSSPSGITLPQDQPTQLNILDLSNHWTIQHGEESSPLRASQRPLRPGRTSLPAGQMVEVADHAMAILLHPRPDLHQHGQRVRQFDDERAAVVALLAGLFPPPSRLDPRPV